MTLLNMGPYDIALLAAYKNHKDLLRQISMSIIVRIYHSLTLLTYVFDIGRVLPASVDFDIDCNHLIQSLQETA